MFGTLVTHVGLTALFAASATAQLVECNTKYATTSRDHVPTTTITKSGTFYDNEVSTKTLKSTLTTTGDYPATVTTTLSAEFVYTFFNASRTVTIPPRTGFTPIASAGPVPGTNNLPRKKRSFGRRSGSSGRFDSDNSGAQEAQHTSYPSKVVCTTVREHTVTTYYSTTTVYAKTTTKYKHPGSTLTKSSTTYSTSSTTVAASQASFPAECGPDNFIDSFHDYSTYGLSTGEVGTAQIDLPCVPDPSIGTDDSCRYTGGALNSDVDCCVAAYHIGGAGFSTWAGGPAFPAYPGCQTFKLPANKTWNFYVGGSEGDHSDFYIGNLANTALYGGYSD